MSAAAESRHRFQACSSRGEVSALLRRPDAARALAVVGHGAGAGMEHPFLAGICDRLAEHGIATFRYQFPYLERGSRRPDPRPVLEATARSAVAAAQRLSPGLPTVAGGKSMGGRMCSRAAAERPLEGVRGLFFLGFPLHPAGRPGTGRARHLTAIELPMLFLQGSRDRLAQLDLLAPVVARLGERARLEVIGGADHSFAVLKRSGRDPAEVLDELAARLAAWVWQRIGPREETA